ncbi:MAG: sigma-70 family RNA polymerase sigma factor [Actinomycetaceae bacterium]|nr:sigma-70 family RNA polymerase sigma factor [Actinomycetaceae bacterium]
MSQEQSNDAGVESFDITQAPDSLLIHRCIDGDTWAFTILARRYASMMRAYAIRFTSNTADADDVVQESLTAAWQHMHQVKKPEAIRSWLMRLTARKAIDLMRARRSHASIDNVEEPAAAAHHGPDSQTIVRAGIEELSSALDALPQPQRQVWLMRELAGMSYSEIAHDLSISATAVRGRLARARQSLIENMDGWQ